MQDAVQIEALLRRFYANQGKLRGYVFSATRDYHATEDILQEVAIVVAKKASTYDTGRPALPWFMGIARNQIQRFYRSKGREAGHVSFELLEDFLPLFSSFDNEQISDRQVALKGCVEKLPAKQRRIMQLRYVEELDCSQISKTIGNSIQGIYALLKRMKTGLRKCVEFQLQQSEAQ
ncbi:ECF RNA polymerase sigma factor SigD [Pontiella desulfatans]|uniref:ECF RNA polymerase sigma factor SigD n=1 Tax=Pontiella desulfatans TaxID=2750659 RepID=A0A6C2UDV9_PONDE|nr:sigma-70 family RNA polymerase sigma factor [Pontiella desulfatans]VGO17554.1 ECF RNA polymerase sigma factor SigD [Pontiella desulfatans]